MLIFDQDQEGLGLMWCGTRAWYAEDGIPQDPLSTQEASRRASELGFPQGCPEKPDWPCQVRQR